MARRILSMVIAVAMILTVIPQAMITVQSAGGELPVELKTALSGNGHGNNGKFIAPIEPPIAGSRPIPTLDELLKIGVEYNFNENFHLTADIDLAGIDWVPIGGSGSDSFTGIFDGQGYVIKNMTTVGESRASGLFSNVSGMWADGVRFYNYVTVIKNLGMENVHIDTSAEINAAAGALFSSGRGHTIVDNCYVTGSITTEGSGASAGGFAVSSQAVNPPGLIDISNSYNAADVTAIGLSFNDSYPEFPVYVSGMASAAGIVANLHNYSTVNNVHNIGNITATATGGARAGGIVGGFSRNDAIQNCSNSGNITATSSGVFYGIHPGEENTDVLAGGIVGVNFVNDNIFGAIRGCYNTGDVSATMTVKNDAFRIFAGGIGGLLHSTTSDCYNTGKIMATNPDNTTGHAGGIVGSNSGRSSIRRSYNTGTVSGFKPGGIVGLNLTGGVIRHNFVLSGTAPNGVAEGDGESGVTVLTSAQMRLEASFPTFNFSRTWGLKSGENDGFPVLQAFFPGWSYTATAPVSGPSEDFLAPIEAPVAGSFPIGSIEDLQKIGVENGLPMSWDYHLTANLDLTGINWEPIGTSDNPFMGTFDGQGHVIRNLEVVGDVRHAGLFGDISFTGNSSCAFKNLALEDVYINVSSSHFNGITAGGLVGYNWQSDVTVSNVYVTGEVNATGESAVAGGIIGGVFVNYNGSHDFIDCANYADVTATATNGAVRAGGLISIARSTTSNRENKLQNNHNYGKITANATGHSAAGGLAALVIESNIVSGNSNSGEITATSSGANVDVVAGGIFASRLDENRNFGMTVSHNSNTGNVTALFTANSTSGTNFTIAGGIAGVSRRIAMSDCYNTGNITAMNGNNLNGYAGGLIGRIYTESSIRRSYTTGDVQAAPHAGAVIGEVLDSGVYTNNVFWNSEAVLTKNNEPIAQADKKAVAVGEVETVKTTAMTLAQMRQEATFARGFNFTEVWGFRSGVNDGLPILQASQSGWKFTPTVPRPAPTRDFLIKDFDPPAEDSIPIATREGLELIREDLTGKFHLTANIDLTGIDWIPIGDSSNPFEGVLDGQGYAITGLEVIQQRVVVNGARIGFFHTVKGGQIKNLGLEDVFLMNTAWSAASGGFAGVINYAEDSPTSVDNCYVTGSVISGGEDTVYAGGITANLTAWPSRPTSEIVNSYNAADVITSSNLNPQVSYGGGLVGVTSNNVRIWYSHNRGNVTGDMYVGGIVGRVTQSYDWIPEIAHTSNSGNVTLAIGDRYSGYVGGITGELRGKLHSSHNTGNVSILTDSTSAKEAEAGGLVGRNSGEYGEIANSYNHGTVTVQAVGANAYAGGIVGNSAANSSVSTSYNTGSLTAVTNLGAIAGNVAANATITNTFWNNEATQKVGTIELPAGTRRGIGNGTGSAVGLTSSAMKSAASFTGFDFDEVWDISSSQNDGYPTLRTKLPTYTVRLIGDSGSSVIGSYFKGETVSITAPAPYYTTYRFAKWTASSDDVVFKDSNSRETTFVMPANHVVVTATYENIPSFMVTVASGSGGGARREGATVSITGSTPPSGKVFKEWIADGDDVVFADKNSRSTTFVMPDRDVTVTATYQDIDAVNCNLGGSCGKNPCQTPEVCSPTDRVPCSCCAADNIYVGKTGHILANETVTIFDALEVLKALVGMDGAIARCGNAKNASRITKETRAANSNPTIFDVLEILKKLVGMDNEIDNPK
ncbi:MAG: hypothetical protein FWG83_07235 [Oscillospiraceae bacterium]|nr:hypothetical protein [Oscillospiraceae bacterium]